MKKAYSLSSILILIGVLQLSSQIDSTYRISEKQSSFSNIYHYKDKYQVVGYNVNVDESNSVFSLELSPKLKTSNIKQANIEDKLQYTVVSDKTIDGNYLIVGYINYYSPYREIYKVDFEGNVLMHRRIQDDSFAFPTKIIQTSDSGFLITGYNYSGGYSAVLMKLRKDGNTEFYKNYNTSSSYSILGYGLAESANNYYLLMAKEKNAVQSPPYFEDNGLIYKLNKKGDSLASYSDNKGNISIGYSALIVVENQGYLYNGHVIDSMVFDTINRKIYYLKKPFIAMKSLSGTALWQKTFSKTSDKWAGFNKIKRLKDGNYLAVGNIYNPTSSDSSSWGYVVKFSSSGTILWEQKYRSSYLYKYNEDGFTDFLEETSGDIILIGGLHTITRDGTSFDFNNTEYGWALKIGKNGGELSSVRTSERNLLESNFKVFPNPVSSSKTIHIELPVYQESDKGAIALYNMEGKEVKKFSDNMHLHTGIHVLKYDVGDIPKGNYIIEIAFSNKIQRAKVVVE